MLLESNRASFLPTVLVDDQMQQKYSPNVTANADPTKLGTMIIT